VLETGDCCGPVVGLSLIEARRIAANIVKLPELMGESPETVAEPSDGLSV
jgi:hypothetical protein